MVGGGRIRQRGECLEGQCFTGSQGNGPCCFCDMLLSEDQISWANGYRWPCLSWPR